MGHTGPDKSRMHIDKYPTWVGTETFLEKEIIKERPSSLCATDIYIPMTILV